MKLADGRMLSLVWLVQVGSASQAECLEQPVLGLRVLVQCRLVRDRFEYEVPAVAFLGGSLQRVVDDPPPGDRIVGLKD